VKEPKVARVVKSMMETAFQLTDRRIFLRRASWFGFGLLASLATGKKAFADPPDCDLGWYAPWTNSASCQLDYPICSSEICLPQICCFPNWALWSCQTPYQARVSPIGHCGPSSSCPYEKVQLCGLPSNSSYCYCVYDWPEGCHCPPD
jgi:hypothetical protein